ncbi:amidohydrolase family protein [Streptomyces sp. NRRL S-646]|uniref:amidohydrolase family protein n=1 Tax=Streptomyces sp. NRRL S-646 TaxID=1463917 RepID=UPI00099D070E|nr:amidohydrolase family protein [Streptomyces sp. NRRL S-646]
MGAATTTNAASALRLSDQTGRLAAGCRADILVVDGDPLAGLDALRAVWLVLAGGRFHIPDSAALSWAQAAARRGGAG